MATSAITTTSQTPATTKPRRTQKRAMAYRTPVIRTALSVAWRSIVAPQIRPVNLSPPRRKYDRSGLRPARRPASLKRAAPASSCWRRQPSPACVLAPSRTFQVPHGRYVVGQLGFRSPIHDRTYGEDHLGL